MIREFFLTEILGTPVIDKTDTEVGRVSDLLMISGEPFPKVLSLEIKGWGGRRSYVDLADLHIFSRRFISLSSAFRETRSESPPDETIFLARDLMDKQIVDTEGCKVVRVNDLKMTRIAGEIRLLAADTGVSGLLRRLGLERLAAALARLLKKQLPEHLIPWSFVAPLSTGLSRVKLTIPRDKLANLHPADIAEIVSQLSPQERVAIIGALSDSVAAEMLSEVEPEIQASIMESLDAERASHIIEEMSPDDAADFLGELPQEKAREILSGLDSEDAEDIEELLEYDDQTAGGLMTTEIIAFSQNLTVEQTIEKLRELEPEAEMIYYLYVVDEEEHLVGVLSLRDLIVARPQEAISNITRQKVYSVKADAPVRSVADKIARYNLLALPVVDEENRLLGLITVDDAIDVIYPQERERKRVPRAWG
ncbi:MAG: magnesium transporter [Armatimonadetes bacterium]|nr:magnesium transporter [Armatimonadota bacterium]